MYRTPSDTAHHRLLVKEQKRTVQRAKRAWNDVSPDWISQTWEQQIPMLARDLAAAQTSVAASSMVASAGALETQGSWAPPKAFLNPASFGEATSTGGRLEGLLYRPVIQAKELITAGHGVTPAMEKAGQLLSVMLASTLADVARSAASIGTLARPGSGYVRIVHGDACDRCLILAGKFYRWNQGFLRHPRCNCSHVEAHLSKAAAEAHGMYEDPYEAFKGLSEAEQNAKFGKARAQAIRDGADIFQVVNSRAGMTPNGLFTTAGTSKRGHAGKILKPGQRRATPELLYKWAGNDRDKALALLKEHGYILEGGQNPLGVLIGQREGFGAMGRGGTRKAASQAVLEARRTGVRDPTNRYTMTAAERRLYDAEQDWLAVLDGRNPFVSGGFGNIPDPHGLGLNKIGAPLPRELTPEVAAFVEKRYLATLATQGEKFIR